MRVLLVISILFFALKASAQPIEEMEYILRFGFIKGGISIFLPASMDSKYWFWRIKKKTLTISFTLLGTFILPSLVLNTESLIWS